MIGISVEVTKIVNLRKADRNGKNGFVEINNLQVIQSGPFRHAASVSFFGKLTLVQVTLNNQTILTILFLLIIGQKNPYFFPTYPSV